MTRRHEVELSAADILGLQLQEWLYALDNVPTEQRARCAESVACEMVVTMTRYDHDWSAMLALIDTYPSASHCGLLLAASQVTTGPRRVDLARRSAAMRHDLGREDWLDHIGSAVPTGRAARDDTYRGQLVWLVELDDGLHRYCLMTGQDLHREILQWSGFYPALDEMESAGDVLTDVPLSEAIVGMRSALEMPPMFGVSTSVQALGPFVRWRVQQLDPVDLLGPDEVSWKDPIVHERVQPNAVRAD